MNSSDIFDLIAQIAADPSKKRKEELLVNYECEHGSAELRRVLTAALDPLTTYGIRALPGRDAPTGENAAFDEHTWSLIDKMASRELTGNLMLQSVQAELNRLGEKSAELLRRILLKDLKAGFGDNTVNKAMPGTIREFPYMRCSLPKGDKLDKLPWAKGVISQEKADAMFMNVNHVTGGLVMLFSRSGTMFPTEAFGRLIDEIRTTFKPDTQTHGEMMVTRDGKILPREEGNGILNHVQSGGSFGANETPLFYVWDQIPLAQIKPKAKINIGYIARLSALGEQLASAKPKIGRAHV